MDNRSDSARLEAHAALVEAGFIRVFDRPGSFLYRGTVDPFGLSVPITIEVKDFDFVSYPIITIDKQFDLQNRKLPHILGTDRTVCYYARGAIILDRYDPGGSVLRCITKCEQVIRDAVAGKSNADFADEFGAYWSSLQALADLPANASGTAAVKYIRLENSQEPIPVLAKDSSWLWERDISKSREDHLEYASVVRTNTALSINPNWNWPPHNLTELDKWLRWNDPALAGKMQEALGRSSDAHAILAIQASNGLFLCRSSLPQAYRREEFVKTHRKKLPKVVTSIGSKISIERINSAPADAKYVFERNLRGNSNLAGKRILLIGCGTIGGFLAQQLAQCGAGYGNGELTLVDSDLLYPSNLGRHVLGAPYLYEPKATACASFIKGQLPPLNIRSFTEPAEHFAIGFGTYDLVVDATGEEALSLALNDRAVRDRPRSPAHLFVWLEGNGAIAKSILTDDPEKACLKCLKPQLAQAPRHKTLKSDQKFVVEQNASCGDGAYVPFPVSRSVGAAALACDHILDWANGVKRDCFRSRTFDNAKAYNIPDSSVSRSPDCPACGRAHT